MNINDELTLSTCDCFGDYTCALCDLDAVCSCSYSYTCPICEEF